ncbi:MAG TPA: polysaccharide deacetylase family protein [Candidatus Limnocylindria bacterium]|nr:polysaccharide deacetylase family protein [Candidatus Limnocylindria bacterium]
MRRRLLHLALVALVATVATGTWALTGPSAALAVSPTPSAPMAMRLEAGHVTGHLLNPSTGAISGSKAVTIAAPTTVQSTQRAFVGSRGGFFLRMSTGPLAGYWVRESIVAYVIGFVGQQIFSPPRTITIPAGDVQGFKFDASGGFLSGRVVRFATASSASASMAAAINGTIHYAITSGPLAGTWVPSGGSSRARVLACDTTPKRGGAPAVWTRLTAAGPEISLTFDLGGRTDPALAIVKRLFVHGVCTTIFATGDAAATSAGNAVLEFVDNYPALFEIGNHTKDHCDLVRGGGASDCPASRPSASFIASQLTSTETTVKAITGMSTKPYWRPPFGAHDAGVRAAAAAAGWTKTVMWDIDTIDWRPPPPSDTGPSAVQIIDKVLGRATNGSIVLMHLGGYNTYPALPSLISGLRGRGLVPTSLSDLADGT